MSVCTHELKEPSDSMGSMTDLDGNAMKMSLDEAPKDAVMVTACGTHDENTNMCSSNLALSFCHM